MLWAQSDNHHKIYITQGSCFVRCLEGIGASEDIDILEIDIDYAILGLFLSS